MQQKRGTILGSQCKAFIEGCKFDKKFWASYVFDVIFGILLVISFIIWSILLKRRTAVLSTVDPSKMFGQIGDQLGFTQSVLQSFLIYVVLSVIVLFLINIILFSIFKGLAWCNLLNKKISFRYFRDLFFISLIYSILLIILIVSYALRAEMVGNQIISPPIPYLIITGIIGVLVLQILFMLAAMFPVFYFHL